MEQKIDGQLDEIIIALSRLRIPLTQSEYQLHEWIAAALRSGGFDVRHEVNVAPRCRIDFMVGHVGIEVKRGKPARGPLINQCARYLASAEVKALILVLDKAISLPNELGGKRLITFGLNRLWGVALP